MPVAAAGTAPSRCTGQSSSPSQKTKTPPETAGFSRQLAVCCPARGRTQTDQVQRQASYMPKDIAGSRSDSRDVASFTSTSPFDQSGCSWSTTEMPTPKLLSKR